MSKPLTPDLRSLVFDNYLDPDLFEVRRMKIRVTADLIVNKAMSNEQIEATSLDEVEKRLSHFALGGKFKVTTEIIGD
ncbi:hypothetical protein [Kineococcus sp. NPDC059986]|uniref:hypothetical protein n=1 Tax=Actinomycetes TaxID=1760 RepID=UPI003450BE83